MSRKAQQWTLCGTLSAETATRGHGQQGLCPGMAAAL